jgi:hypothetical protein
MVLIDAWKLSSNQSEEKITVDGDGGDLNQARHFKT